MGWPWWWRDEPEKYVPELVSTINAATIHEKTLLLCHRLSSFPGADEELSGFLDVWWTCRAGWLGRAGGRLREDLLGAGELKVLLRVDAPREGGEPRRRFLEGS